MHSPRICAVVNLLSGYLCSILAMRSLHSSEMEAHLWYLKETSFFRIFALTSSLEAAQKGGTPHIARYMTTPAAQMSISGPYDPISCSGAMYSGVPMTSVSFLPEVKKVHKKEQDIMSSSPYCSQVPQT